MSGSPNPPMMMPQMSASCPNKMQDDHTRMHGELQHLRLSLCSPPTLVAPPVDMKLVEKERQKKNNHNMSRF